MTHYDDALAEVSKLFKQNAALSKENAELRERAEKAEAEVKALRPEYGIHAEWISTLSSEGPVAETLGDALEALAAFDAKHGTSIVSRELVVRPVGDWRSVRSMAEPMSEERLGADLDAAELLAVARAHHAAYVQSHSHAGAFACCSAHTSADDVPELVAEVERLRAVEARMRAVINEDITAYETQLNAIHEARDYWQDQTVKATTRAETAERELAEMRERLGEHPEEWGVALTEGDTSTTSAGKREDVARRSVAADPEHRRLMHRRGASGWKEVAGDE